MLLATLFAFAHSAAFDGATDARALSRCGANDGRRGKRFVESQDIAVAPDLRYTAAEDAQE